MRSGYTPNVIEELGDFLWYLSVVASRGGIALSDIAGDLHGSDGPASSFSSLQAPLSYRISFDETAVAVRSRLVVKGHDGERHVTDHGTYRSFKRALPHPVFRRAILTDTPRAAFR